MINSDAPFTERAQDSYLLSCRRVVGDYWLFTKQLPSELWNGVKESGQLICKDVLAIVSLVLLYALAPLVIPYAAYRFRHVARKELADTVAKKLEGRPPPNSRKGTT